MDMPFTVADSTTATNRIPSFARTRVAAFSAAWGQARAVNGRFRCTATLRGEKQQRRW
jgi:hypothetical protein